MFREHYQRAFCRKKTAFTVREVSERLKISLPTARRILQSEVAARRLRSFKRVGDKHKWYARVLRREA